MPNSCKCILDRMVFNGAMTKEERDKILRNMSKNKPMGWIDEKGNIIPIVDEEIVRKEEREKTIDEIEDIVDEINNQGFHCKDDYCDDDNHDCAECMAKAILYSLARMKSNAEYEKEQK